MTSTKIPGLIGTILQNKCPRCREGNLFSDPNPYHLRRMMDMPVRCTVCNHRFEEQPAFFFGTAYVSYALTVAFSVATFVLWFIFVGISVDDSRIIWWFSVNALLLLSLQPVIQRLSRSIWLSFFIQYDATRKTKIT